MRRSRNGVGSASLSGSIPPARRGLSTNSCRALVGASSRRWRSIPIGLIDSGSTLRSSARPAERLSDGSDLPRLGHSLGPVAGREAPSEGRRGAGAIVALLALAALLLPSPAGAAERPNFVHILTDDQTVDSVPFMPFTRLPARGRGHDVLQPPRGPAALLPVAGQLPDRPVPAQPRRPQQPAAVRLRPPQLQAHALHGAPPRRVPDRLDRQAPQRPRGARDPARSRASTSGSSRSGRASCS